MNIAFWGRVVAKLLVAAQLALLTACGSVSSKEYDVRIRATLIPENGVAQVTLTIPNASLLSRLDFNVGTGTYHKLTANGQLSVASGRAVWDPPPKAATLSYEVEINHERDSGEFDALVTPSFALFRGDDLVPPVKVTGNGDASSITRLEIVLPKAWTSVESGWPRVDKTTFSIDNPERRFDRPTGWFIAGQLGIRRNNLQSTEFVVAAPRESGVRRMDILAFATLLWPQITDAFGKVPRKVLVVGAGDPFWRGGLSAPNSFFLHGQRPLISENGTSTVVHELVHVVTGLSATEDSDWVVEGLAEYYSFELLYRAGATTAARRHNTLEWLTQWSAGVESLRTSHSKGPVTARAAVLFDQLDQEIQAQSDGHYDLDDLVRVLMGNDKVSTSDIRGAYQQLLGKPAKTLHTELLE